MIRILRYLAVRLWICAGAGIPLAFVLMPYVDKMAPGIHPAVGVFLILGGLFFAAGFLLNLIGKRAMEGQIREAETWARAGIVHRSEVHFLKALRIYDSFLLSPWKAGQPALRLAGSVARFSLAHGGINPVFIPLAALFLKKVPRDREIALIWLKRFAGAETISIQGQDLLERLADAWADDPEIVSILAGLFIESGRRDYCAKKLYAAVLADPDTDNRTRTEIAAIIGTKDNGFPISRSLYDFNEKGGGPDLPARMIRSGIKGVKSGVQLFFGTLLHTTKTLLSGVDSFLRRGLFCLKTNRKIFRTVQWAVILLLCSGFIIFMASTLMHLFNERHIQPPAQSIELQVPKLFTIQVAAYLKKNHARTYLEKLKRNGLDAYLAEADGGGRTWYLVRISSFKDRQDARAYGRRLKQEGKIEDFFVDNNEIIKNNTQENP